MRKARPATQETRSVPGAVWALGFVSMFMDISSEMIHSLLPVFLTSVLGASMGMVGLIEGVGEATASITKVFSGWLSDRLGRRKGLALLGYGLGALSKPFFAMAPAVSWVFGARVVDRLGKGIRGAPRDAMIADLTRADSLGAAFGLRQSLDTVGAFLGPLIALVLMEVLPGKFRAVFWVAVVPGLIAVLILTTSVREPSHHSQTKAPQELHVAEVGRLGAGYWRVVAVATLLTLGRFSEAFLILRAVGEGLPVTLAPLVLILMNVVYAASAYPIGALSDRLGRRHLLGPGFATLIAADLVLALTLGIPATMIGIGLWGLHLGMTQGVLSALVADTSPARLRGSAFGLFNLLTGVAVLAASVVAGLLWQTVGPKATFLCGAALTAAGLLAAGTLLLRPGDRH